MIILIGCLLAGCTKHDSEGVETRKPAAGEAGSDGRIVIALTPDQRDHISGEMLTLLGGIQELTAALSDDDRAYIKEVAAELSVGVGGPVGESIRETVPVPFRQLSQGLRQDFATLAQNAETAELEDLQRHLSDTMGRCVACHTTYSVVEAGR